MGHWSYIADSKCNVYFTCYILQFASYMSLKYPRMIASSNQKWVKASAQIDTSTFFLHKIQLSPGLDNLLYGKSVDFYTVWKSDMAKFVKICIFWAYVVEQKLDVIEENQCHFWNQRAKISPNQVQNRSQQIFRSKLLPSVINGNSRFYSISYYRILEI